MRRYSMIVDKVRYDSANKLIHPGVIYNIGMRTKCMDCLLCLIARARNARSSSAISVSLWPSRSIDAFEKPFKSPLGRASDILLLLYPLPSVHYVRPGILLSPSSRFSFHLGDGHGDDDRGVSYAPPYRKQPSCRINKPLYTGDTSPSILPGIRS